MSEKLVPFDSLITNEEIVALPGFQGLINGEKVLVTAVLERTVVYEPAPGEARQLARHQDCLVDPNGVQLKQISQGPAAQARQAARRGMEASRRSQRQPHNPAA
ncbi:MAG TPA: hypothetical protein VG015_10275 [Candidatus Dormibacteraeota bacterium]|jgi:hypothetical protein|nr:hypothetical protein [Candidatus Dormibacteraeota bacterium]